jgi:hypothetical protein
MAIRRINKPLLIFGHLFALFFLFASISSDETYGGIFFASIALLFIRRGLRPATTVSLNIEKKMYFVATGSGGYGGNWPPSIGLQVRLDESMDGKWITSL